MNRITFLLIATILAAGLPANAGPLRCGAVAVDITPRHLPVSMTGGFQDRQAMSVHDRLFARCLVLEEGTTRVAIVICDSCLITRDIYDAAKVAASKQTGIPASQMLTAATHTHTAPTATPLAQCRPDPRYVEQLTGQIAQAIIEANDRLSPCEIAWGTVAVPEELNNRRWFVKPEALKPNPFGRVDDQVVTNPPAGSDVLIRPAGPVDPDVGFVSVRTAVGQPAAFLANYGLHYVGGIPSAQLSADYFGEFARQIASRLGADETFVGIMSNGASGDVNNTRFLNPRARSEPFQRIRDVATTVADRVDAARAALQFHSDVSIRMKEQELELGVRQPDEVELTRARSVLAAAKNPDRLTTKEVYAQEAIKLSELDPTVRIKLQALVINDLAIVAIPCEIFAEVGLEIKRRSPFRSTFIIDLANGYNGYLPSPRQHALGGYETWPSGWSYLEVEAASKISDSVHQMLLSLKAPSR